VLLVLRTDPWTGAGPTVHQGRQHGGDKAKVRVGSPRRMVMYKSYAKIIDARWTPQGNILIIRCGKCDAIFNHRADRFIVRCPTCSSSFGLEKMRRNITWKI
jgi:uncharacterized C2H2 Zn-finger protein